MLTRTPTIIALCIAICAGSVLGLGNGMVLVVHDDGHVGIEHAYVRHAHDHAAGADHEDHDYTPDADHATLHAALASQFDSCLAQPGQQQSFQAVKRATELPALPLAFGPHPLKQPSLALARRCRCDARGVTAPQENARLRTVILVL